MEDLWKNEEYRNNMRESFKKARRKSWSNEEFATKQLSNMLEGVHRVWNDPEWREKRIENLMGDKNPNAKAVENIETNKIFSTIKEASEWAGLKSVSGIGQCYKGKSKSAGRHPETGEPLHWRYANKEVI